MQDLGNAINESLSDSDRIAEAIGEIKRSGYDVFLILEATIGFNKRETPRSDVRETDESELGGPGTIRKSESTGKFRWTSQDQKFLKALKISVDPETK